MFEGTFGAKAAEPMRMAQLDIDMLYDADPVQMDRNVKLAIRNLKASAVNTVALQAFSDMDGDGNVDSMYFDNHLTRTEANVFDSVSRQLHDAGMKVYGWIPTLAIQGLTEGHPEDKVVAVNPEDKPWYDRATPFSPRVREELKQFAHEMATRTSFDGILFQDDLYLADSEDFSAAGQAAYRQKFGKELTQETLMDRDVFGELAQFRSEALSGLTKEMMAEFRDHKPDTKFARNMYTDAVINQDHGQWYGQDLKQYLKDYDYTVLMGYTRMEKIADKDAADWLRNLVDNAFREPGAQDKVVFKLQGQDWKDDSWIPVDELKRNVDALKSRGAKNIGYYPVDILSEGLKLPY